MSRTLRPVGASWRELWASTSRTIGDQAHSRWLLEEASGADRAELLRRLDEQAPPAAAARLEGLVKRLLAGEPLQHVLGHWGFRTLEVAVDSRVLVPRPETETVVSIALSVLDASQTRRSSRAGSLVADLGTGSGVIALSLVAERSAVRVTATDCSADALEVAAANLSCLAPEASARVQLRRGDWYGALSEDVAGSLDLIVSNPPYLAQREWQGLDRLVRDFEPPGALIAGPSGLEAIETIVAGAPEWLAAGGSLVVEIAPDQAGRVLELAGHAGFSTASVEEDLSGRARVLVARQ